MTIRRSQSLEITYLFAQPLHLKESLGKIAKALGSAGVTFLSDDGKGPGIRARVGKAKAKP